MTENLYINTKKLFLKKEKKTDKIIVNKFL